MEPGTLVTQDGAILPPDPAERLLRPLYAVPPTASLRLSMIQAADGSAVGLDGTSRSLNGPEDHRILRVTRSLADAVIVGARTVRAEGYGNIHLGPQLRAARVADGMSELPDLVIITRNARDLPQDLDAERTWIFTNEWGRAKDMTGLLAQRVVTLGDRAVDMGSAYAKLVSLGYRRLLCEGGPELARQLLAAGLVRDYCLTTSPLPSSTGPKVPPVPRTLHALRHRLTGDGFVIERYSNLR